MSSPPPCVCTQTHTPNLFIRISCFLPSLCRKPPFPGVRFFHYKENWKRDGEYFFPSNGFMHLKRSFVTGELALHACTLLALPDGIYIIRSSERERERAGKRAGFMFESETWNKNLCFDKYLLNQINCILNVGCVTELYFDSSYFKKNCVLTTGLSQEGWRCLKEITSN